MTKVLALDQATATGWTFGGTKIDLSDWVSGHFRAPRRDEEGERLTIVEDEVLNLIKRFDPDLIALEAPYNPIRKLISDVQAGKKATYNETVIRFLYGVRAAVIMAASRHSVPTEEYLSQSWRTALQLPTQRPLGAKNDWRKQATFDAVTRLGARPRTYDEADSWGICFYACHGKAGLVRATDDLFTRVIDAR